MASRALIHPSVILASGLFALSACTSSHPNAALEQARASYATASADPVVQTAAPQDLQDAQEFLQKGDNLQKNPSFTTRVKSIWTTDPDKVEIDHNAYMAKRYSEVAQQRAKTRAAALQSTAIVRTMTLGSMLFATNQAVLNKNGMKSVSELATYLKNYPGQSVSVVGYTDSQGSAQHNNSLSQKRAAAVKTELVHQGIQANRVTTQGAGEANPVASNNTAEGRQKNRRVEVAISQSAISEGVGSSAPAGR